jgi:hypothetical protein
MESTDDSVSDEEAVAGSSALSDENDGRLARDSRSGEWDDARLANLTSSSAMSVSSSWQELSGLTFFSGSRSVTSISSFC